MEEQLLKIHRELVEGTRTIGAAIKDIIDSIEDLEQRIKEIEKWIEGEETTRMEASERE